MPTFAHFMEEQRAAIDQRLGASLRPEPGLPDALRQAMRHSLLAPGKRLRPLLVLSACRACGCHEDEAAWPAAVAVEMVHVYSLIHDDLPAMDDDDLRRGLPTCHVAFGEAAAILAGDALLTLAFQTLAEGMPPATAAACCADLARAAGAAGMVGGQADDLAMEGGVLERSLAALEGVHLRKTGALIRASLRLGVRAAFPDAAPPATCSSAWTATAAAWGWPSRSPTTCSTPPAMRPPPGKKVGKDAARNKLTYPGLLGVPGEPGQGRRPGTGGRWACFRRWATGHGGCASW